MLFVSVTLAKNADWWMVLLSMEYVFKHIFLAQTTFNRLIYMYNIFNNGPLISFLIL